MINYSEIFKNSLDKLKSEGNYRVFADLEKIAGNFPFFPLYYNGKTKFMP